MWNDIIKCQVLHIIPNPYDCFFLRHFWNIEWLVFRMRMETGDVMLLKRSKHYKSSLWLVTILQIAGSHAISVWGNRTKFIHWYSSPPPALWSYLCDLNMHILKFGKPHHENQWYLTLFASNLHAWHYIWFSSMQNFSWDRGLLHSVQFLIRYDTTHTQTHTHTNTHMLVFMVYGDFP